jgi:pimeloyl-ACP methyl ester carboxylesterase
MNQSTQPRRFQVRVPDDDIADLAARIDRTRWPDEVNDLECSYGVSLGYLQELVDYWRHRFDWRAAEARVNAFDQYLLEIDGLDVHFIHQRSPHPDATPLLMTHGWPGSVIEFLDVIPRLTEPERFGGSAADAFNVICPSLPGYGYSAAAREPGMHPGEVARREAALMAALGYTRYLAHGGDWGSPITQLLASQDAAHCRAIHILLSYPMPPAGVADPMTLVAPHERVWLEDNARHERDGTGYFHQQSTRPQTLGYALNDSPAGLCAWIAEKFHSWTDCERDGVRDIRHAVSWDTLLANVSLYWYTGTIASSIRLYKEFARTLGAGAVTMPVSVPVPVGMTTYRREIFKTPKAWAERMFNLVYWHEAERGGHFASLEQPQAFVEDMRRFRGAARTALD